MRIGVDAVCWANGRGYGRFTRELLTAMVAGYPDVKFVFFVDQWAKEAIGIAAPNLELASVDLGSAPTKAAAAGGSRSVRDMLRLIFARGALGCPFLAPPGLPPERAALLRQAFDATMKDAAFLADAMRSNLEIAPVAGAALQRLIADVYRTHADVVAKTRAVIR